MQASKRFRLQLQIQKYIFIVLLLTVSGLLAWASQLYSVQFDWTSNKRNSLSAGSVELLHKLENPVSMNVYMADDARVKAAVEEILQRYQREKKDFTYRLINPDIDIELAQVDGVSQYGQIVIKYQGRRETVTSLSEQTISSALQRLGRSGERSLVFLSGHGERRIEGSNNTGYSQLNAELQKRGFAGSQHNLLESPLPDTTTVLVIAAPSKPYLEGELEHVRNYIANGGNLLWMMDPGEMLGLETLAAELGIYFHPGMVVDNNTNLRETMRIQHPAMIPVLDYQAHPITATLAYNSLFPISRGLEQIEDSGWSTTTIAQSLPRSWTESSDLTDSIVFDSNTGDIAGPISIILALERSINTEQPVTAKATQRIIVSGDSDFIANSYIGVGANLELGLNIFNWLAGDDDLMAVEPRNAPDTQLQLDDTEILIISVGFFLALPGGLLITGFLIWFKRRKQ